MPLPVSLPEIIDASNRALLEGLHTSMPAQVVSYDAATQTITAKPMVKRIVQSVDSDEVKYENLPNIDGVPVAFQRGGGYAITLPLAPGDFVWLQFSEASIGEFRATGQVSEPRDSRRHSLGYPIAVPAGYPDTMKMAEYTGPGAGTASTSEMIVGKESGGGRIKIGPTFVQVGDGATVDFAAMASKVDANFAAVQTALANIQTWANSHVHQVATLGAPTSTCSASVPPSPLVGGTVSPQATPAQNAKIT